MSSSHEADPYVQVAVVQAGSVLFDTPRTLEKLAGLAAQAKQAGAQVVLFPEAFVGGYPKGKLFGLSVGQRTPEGREEFREYFEGAVAIPSPEFDFLSKIARENGIHLVTGIIERAGGTLYCTVLFFGPGGELLGKHRKLMPTALERVIWGCGDGSTLDVVQTEHGRLGAVICWENYMPLLRMAMYAKGVELYCAPTVDDRPTWIPTVRHIAVEGRCFVLSACQFLPPDEKESSPGIRGGSCIVSPFGELLAGPVYDAETILTARLDRRERIRGTFDLDVVGHYARPDVFRLQVDETPKNSVAPFSPDQL